MKHAHKLAFLLVVLCCVFAYAQDKQDKKDAPKDEPKAAAKDDLAPSVYRIEFSISELEAGKRLNTRAYTLMARDREWAKTDMSTRVPVVTGSSQAANGGPGINTQFQYLDVGLSFSLYPRQTGDHIVLDGRLSMTSFAPADEAKLVNTAAVPAPVLRRVSTDFQAAVQSGKQTTVALLDDITSKKQYQLEATVTKIK